MILSPVAPNAKHFPFHIISFGLCVIDVCVQLPDFLLEVGGVS